MGHPASPRLPARHADTNMSVSIAMLFLFFPLAIPAIRHAARVAPLLQRGEQAAAAAELAESRRWTRRALRAGFIFYGIVLIGVTIWLGYTLIPRGEGGGDYTY